MAFYGPFLRNSDWGLASVYQWIKIHRYKMNHSYRNLAVEKVKEKVIGHWEISSRTGQQDGQTGMGVFG
jgi:hypothetical protein